MIKKVWEYVKDFLSKYKYAALVCVIGIAAASIPSCGAETKLSEPQEENEPVDPYIMTADELAERMSAVFSKIKGVGTAQVILTVKSGYETVYVYDEDTKTTIKDASAEESRDKSLARISTQKGEEAVKSRVDYPKFLGALVVCEGGGDATIQYELTKAVSSLTGLSADKIVVLKMK